MISNDEIIQGFRRINKQPATIAVAEVLAVNKAECTCKVKLNDNEMENVRLKADINGDNGCYNLPKVNSTVLIALINNDSTNAFVSAYSEIDKIILKNENINTTIDFTNGKFNIANKDISLIDIFSSFITELKNAIITTPSGAGSISPTTATKLTAVENDFKKIFE